MAGKHVFISYSRTDAEWAIRVDAELRQAGYEVWRDDRGLPEEHDYTSALEHAIEEASHVVVCLTPGALSDTSYVRREVQFALMLADPRFRKTRPNAPPAPSIVPIVFPGGRPLIHISTRIYLSLEDEARFPKLVQDLLERLRSPSETVIGTQQSDPARMDYLRELLDWIHRALPASREQLLDLHVRATSGATETFRPRMSIQLATDLRHSTAVTSVAEALEAARGRLLLLGSPGSGKTTSLLLLARRLATAALDDATAPIPALGSLRLWKREQPLQQWLGELVPRELQGLPRIHLLDGLDELPPRTEENGKVSDPRATLLDALSRELAQLPVVLTSREEDFRQLGRRAALRAAATIAPIDDATIDTYATRLGVADILGEQDSALRSLLATPLGLTLLRRTSEASPRRRLRDVRELVDAFVTEVVGDGAEQVREALGHFALRQVADERVLGYWGITARPPIPDPVCIEAAARAGILKPSRKGGREFMHAVLLDHFAMPALERFSSEIDDEEQLYHLISWIHHVFGVRAIPLMVRLVQERITSEHRKDLAISLRTVRDERYVPLLLVLLTTNTHWTDGCEDTLFEMGTSILPQLVTALLDGEGRIPWAAARVLARHADAGIERLLAALEAPSVETRLAALEHIPASAHVALANVRTLFRDPAPRVRAAAFDAAHRIAPDTALPEARTALADADPAVRASAAQAVTDDDPQTIDALVALLGDGNSFVRACVADALMTRKRFELLTPYLTDTDGTAGDAASMLPKHAKTAPTEWLVALMCNSQNKWVRENASLALEGRTDATDALLHALANDPEEFVRVGAARSLAPIPGTAVDQALTSAIATSGRLTEWVIDSLAKRGEDILLHALRDALARGMLVDTDGELTWAGMYARHAIEDLESPAARELLRELPDPLED